MNLHVNVIGNKKHKLIKENHRRSFENYEGKVLNIVNKKFNCILLNIIKNYRRSINKSDEVIEPEWPILLIFRMCTQICTVTFDKHVDGDERT